MLETSVSIVAGVRGSSLWGGTCADRIVTQVGARRGGEDVTAFCERRGHPMIALGGLYCPCLVLICSTFVLPAPFRALIDSG